MCALVIGVYASVAHSGIPSSGRMGAADNYYNLLVQSFRAGQLNLKKEVPPVLAQLADPYAPSAYASYREEVGDMSYYKGKLYLYFGVTPAVLLFWPYAALTGHYLLQRNAVVIFCLVGFLVSVGLLWALWRRYFAEVNVWVVAAGALALGLATSTPIFLEQCKVNEVPIGCGYALTMLALAAIWKALHESERRCWWLAAASVTYGLAVGARPDLLFGAVILLVPVAQAWRERQKVWPLLLAAVVPVAIIGLGLLIYNFLRFDSPFEFGWRYQLVGMRQDTGSPFYPRYLWFNFRLYFLEPARWGSRFPFVHEIIVPPEPAGHVGGLERTFGVLSNVPLVWLALAVPLGWRGRSAQARSVLCGFLAAVAVLFGLGSLTISLLAFAEGRYEMEFLPALVLLAVIGMLSLERTLADRSAWRCAVRWGWSLLLSFSVAFNLLASIGRSAEAHNALGAALQESGQVQEAIAQYQQALRLNPDYAEARDGLGIALTKQGKVREGIEQFEQALHLNPDYAEVHQNLGSALARMGGLEQAVGHWEQAVRINPSLAEAHYNLGLALMGQGRLQEAIGHFEKALQIQPEDVQAQYNLGNALLQAGEVQEAIGHYKHALQIKPDYAAVHNNLAAALMRQGRLQEAIGHYEQVVRLTPDSATAHYNLGVALEQSGRRQEAVQHYEQALRIKPDFVQAQDALARARAAQ